jgi:predicted RNase H-like nuclease (RuvC/YqgF family)
LQVEILLVMEDYSILIAGVEFKVRQLIEVSRKQSTELQKMKHLIESLQNENDSLQKQLSEAISKNNTEAIAKAIENAKDSKKIKLMINDYIREIDKCIAYLNSP